MDWENLLVSLSFLWHGLKYTYHIFSSTNRKNFHSGVLLKIIFNWKYQHCLCTQLFNIAWWPIWFCSCTLIIVEFCACWNSAQCKVNLCLLKMDMVTHTSYIAASWNGYMIKGSYMLKIWLATLSWVACEINYFGTRIIYVAIKSECLIVLYLCIVKYEQIWNKLLKFETLLIDREHAQ